MLRNLQDEFARRRWLPFAALAVLVAIAAPLLFLKSAPDNAPSAGAAPAAAAEAKLPARAARLLAATDAGQVAGRAGGASHDPFNPPASYRAAAAAASSPSSAPAAPAAAGTSGTPVPVVIQDAGGSSSKSTSTTHKSTPAASTKNSAPSPDKTTLSAKSARTIAVDVRYGPKKDTKIRRAIPRNKAFYIHGKLVAIFLKYSPSRHKAVFAVAPGLHISGPVKCRVADGACRYLDIPAGSHAWLTMITAERTIVARRLDVVHTELRATGLRSRATAAAARDESACLAGKLMAMKPGDRLIDRDACER